MFVNIPPNCTDRLQPMDLSVNKSCKDFIKSKFVDWYSVKLLISLYEDETSEDAATNDFRLSVTKPLGAQWLMSFYDYIRSKPTVVSNGFRAAGISDHLN